MSNFLQAVILSSISIVLFNFRALYISSEIYEFPIASLFTFSPLICLVLLSRQGEPETIQGALETPLQTPRIHGRSRLYQYHIFIFIFMSLLIAFSTNSLLSGLSMAASFGISIIISLLYSFVIFISCPLRPRKLSISKLYYFHEEDVGFYSFCISIGCTLSEFIICETVGSNFSIFYAMYKWPNLISPISIFGFYFLSFGGFYINAIIGFFLFALFHQKETNLNNMDISVYPYEKCFKNTVLRICLILLISFLVIWTGLIVVCSSDSRFGPNILQDFLGNGYQTQSKSINFVTISPGAFWVKNIGCSDRGHYHLPGGTVVNCNVSTNDIIDSINDSVDRKENVMTFIVLPELFFTFNSVRERDMFLNTTFGLNSTENYVHSTDASLENYVNSKSPSQKNHSFDNNKSALKKLNISNDVILIVGAGVSHKSNTAHVFHNHREIGRYGKNYPLSLIGEESVERYGYPIWTWRNITFTTAICYDMDFPSLINNYYGDIGHWDQVSSEVYQYMTDDFKKTSFMKDQKTPIPHIDIFLNPASDWPNVRRTFGNVIFRSIESGSFSLKADVGTDSVIVDQSGQILNGFSSKLPENRTMVYKGANVYYPSYFTVSVLIGNSFILLCLLIYLLCMVHVVWRYMKLDCIGY